MEKELLSHVWNDDTLAIKTSVFHYFQRAWPIRAQRTSTATTNVLCCVLSCLVLSCVLRSLFVTPWTEEPGRLQSMGILQARILEWVVMSSSRGSSQPRDGPRSPALKVDSLPSEPPGMPNTTTEFYYVSALFRCYFRTRPQFCEPQWLTPQICTS